MSPGDSTVLFRAIPASIRLSPLERKQVRQFAAQLAGQLAASRGFTCLVTNDRELHELNIQFLGHDYPTDVLSFPSSEGSADLGELAISIERAAVQASEFGHCRLDEIKILMLHGLLHLTGLDHESDNGEMAEAETEWRRHFNLPASLIERCNPIPAAEPLGVRP